MFGALVYLGYGNVSMSVTITPSTTAPLKRKSRSAKQKCSLASNGKVASDNRAVQVAIFFLTGVDFFDFATPIFAVGFDFALLARLALMSGLFACLACLT